MVSILRETLSYKIDTVIDINDHIILQSLIDDQKNVISRWVLVTREQGIREALIKLGWTPPKD